MLTLPRLYAYISSVTLLVVVVPTPLPSHISLTAPAELDRVTKETLNYKLTIVPPSKAQTLDVSSMVPVTPPKKDIIPSHLSVKSSPGLSDTDDDLPSESEELAKTKKLIPEVELPAMEKDSRTEAGVAKRQKDNDEPRPQAAKDEDLTVVGQQLHDHGKPSNPNQETTLPSTLFDSNPSQFSKMGRNQEALDKGDPVPPKQTWFMIDSALSRISEWYRKSQSLLARTLRGLERYFHPQKVRQARERKEKEAAEKAEKAQNEIVAKVTERLKAYSGKERPRDEVETSPTVEKDERFGRKAAAITPQERLDTLTTEDVALRKATRPS